MKIKISLKIYQQWPPGKAATPNTLLENYKKTYIPSPNKGSEDKLKARLINCPNKKKRSYQKSSNRI